MDLSGDAGRTIGVNRAALLAVLMLVGVPSASASPARMLRGQGMMLSLPVGWHGLVGGAGVQAADFPLPQRARNSATLVRVRQGRVHLMIFNYGPWVPYLPVYHPARPLLSLDRRDVKWTAIEGFGADYFARLDARLGGDMVDILADLGPKPLDPDALRNVNGVLATLRVPPPRVLLPRNGRLAADGVSVRLLHDWSGRIEIPAHRYGSRMVLRAARGDVHIDLLEFVETEPPHHVDLPITVTSRNVLHRHSPPLARRVFSTGGRSFDLSVAVPRPGDLREANRFLATLRVVPRTWTFRSCDLSLRVPGTWRVGVRPRSGCYPVLKLRGPHVLVVLTELRRGVGASGRILRRAGRRFEVEVTPASAQTRARADAVLATLRAQRRS